MARAPAATRKRSTIIEELEPETDIVNDAITETGLELTPYDELISLFGKLNQTVGDEPLVVVLMTREHSGAKWSRLDSYRSAVKEFDPESTIDRVEHEHGPGEYKFVININGRAYKHHEFKLGDPRKKPIIANKDTGNDMFAMMLQMQSAATERAERQAERQAASQTALITAAMGAMAAIVPALVGNRIPPTDPTTIMANLAGVMKSLMPEPKPETNNLRETVETLSLVKGLFDKGESTDTILGTVKEVAPHLLNTMSETIQSWRNNRQPPIPPSPLPGQPQLTSLPEQPTIVHEPIIFNDPILTLVGEDIIHFAHKGKHPQIAAEFVVAELEEAGITYEQVQQLIAKHVASPNWLESLANDGLDLRAHELWTQEFLRELTEIYEERKTELSGDARPAAGEEGSDRDT